MATGLNHLMGWTLYSPGLVFSYKLRYIVGFWLVEMAISINQKPTIYRNLYENTSPAWFDRLLTIFILPCEAKWQYLLILQISRYCFLPAVPRQYWSITFIEESHYLLAYLLLSLKFLWIHAIVIGLTSDTKWNKSDELCHENILRMVR